MRELFRLGIAWLGWFAVGLTVLHGADQPLRRALPVTEISTQTHEQVLPPAQTDSLGVANDPPDARWLAQYPSDGPFTIASSAIMIDAKNGEVLFSKNADTRRPVASTQKLLTALLIAEHGRLDERIRIAPSDCQVEPTKLGFRPGEVYARRAILNAMLVHSCNDAAICLARNDAGSVPAFSAVMNAKALALGAGSSHFVNPNGLPVPGQYSTARDMARIAYAAYHNALLRSFVRMPGLYFTYNSGRARFLEPTNKLLLRSQIFTGMKTGYTAASGRCLVSSATYSGREVILVQLGGTQHPLFDDAQRLLLWGLNQRSLSHPIAGTF